MTLEDLIQKKIDSCNTIDELTFILKNLIAYNSVDENDNLYSIRALVGSVEGMKIEIYPNEHPPPHFHVKAKDFSAVFSLVDCKLLQGKIGNHEQQMVNWWYKRSRNKLIEFWNNSRPSDCTVGKFVE